MQDLAENMQLSTITSTKFADGFANCSSSSDILSRFCKVQLEQIVARFPIVWGQIAYYDPFLNAHQEMVSCEGRLDPKTQTELKLALEKDFPPVLELKELPLVFSAGTAYLCPIGYRNYQSEHLLIVSKQPLSSTLKQYLISCAKLISNHCELYSSLYHQSAERSLLEQIIHRVGHQLRNPLSLISLYAENLRLELSASSFQAQASVIRDTVQDLLSNLNDLIYCGKSSQLRIALHDIHQLMAETMQELQPWIEEKQLKISYSPESVMLMVDRVQVRQVFANILGNAIHFSPHSGKIHINWQVFQSEVLIQISDQGPGLSENDLKKIFTPFYSKRSGGTGLGLTIAKKIVLDHQGNLWAQNSLEGGAQFSFTLPRR